MAKEKKEVKKKELDPNDFADYGEYMDIL